jgi:hypothetical protein
VNAVRAVRAVRAVSAVSTVSGMSDVSDVSDGSCILSNQIVDCINRIQCNGHLRKDSLSPYHGDRRGAHEQTVWKRKQHRPRDAGEHVDGYRVIISIPGLSGRGRTDACATLVRTTFSGASV